MVDVSPSTVTALKERLRRLAHQVLQRGLPDRGVGRDHREHGRHVGLDHARALRDAGDGDGAPVDHRLPRDRLRHGVGRHDRFGRRGPVAGREVRDAIGQAALDALHGERLHDHAGRERQHRGGRHAEELRRRRTNRARILDAGVPRPRVRHARVHDDRADRPLALEMLAAHRDRRRAEAVAREDACDPRALVERDHQQVLAAGLADARARDPEAHAGNGEQVFGARRLQVDGHRCANLAEGGARRAPHRTRDFTRASTWGRPEAAASGGRATRRAKRSRPPPPGACRATPPAPRRRRFRERSRCRCPASPSPLHRARRGA